MPAAHARHGRGACLAAFDAGAGAVVPKDPPPRRVRHAPARDRAGQRRPPPAPARATATPADCPLTNRELEILRLAAQGLTNGRIARDLWVTEQTVKFHLSNVYRKLGVPNRTEASRYAIQRTSSAV